MSSRARICQMQSSSASDTDIDPYFKFTPLAIRHSKFPEKFQQDHSRCMFLHDNVFALYKTEMLNIGWPEYMILDFCQMDKPPHMSCAENFPALRQPPSLNSDDYPSLKSQVGAPTDNRMENFSVLGSTLTLGYMSRRAHPK